MPTGGARPPVGWAYLLYGCMNVSGLGFHCLLPREPDAEGLPFQVLYAIDVGCTATSCLSLAVAAAALTRVADDRSPAVRRMLLGTYALLPVLCLGVAHAALPDGRLNLFNELVYLVGLLGAYAAVSALAAYRLAFATLRWRWMAAAILVSSIATLTIVFDGWLCLNFGYLINAMNGGYFFSPIGDAPHSPPVRPMPTGLSGVVAICASALTVGLFTSPLKIAQEIRLNKSTGGYSPLPYLAMVLNCFFWALYGYNISDKAILLPNIVGICVALLTLTAFKNNIDGDKQAGFLRTVLISGSVGIILLAWVYLFPPSDNSVARMGFAGAGLSISMFASPFATIKQVIMEKNSSSLPIPMVTMSALACVSWTLYGHMIGDMNVFVPNALGLLFSLAQLTLAGAYPRKSATSVRPASIGTL